MSNNAYTGGTIRI